MLLCLYADPDFVELIQYRFRRDQQPGIVADIFDGSEYVKYSDHKFNVSFALNFDGAPKFKSSGVQIWPIQMYLNELPPHIRYVIRCVLYLLHVGLEHKYKTFDCHTLYYMHTV